ncbi:MAG: hypothetical protein Q7S27_01360 [Nanoarchaeota archaeon]|nr:hypothetical protein [Nanoarchaeota archaeon]
MWFIERIFGRKKDQIKNPEVESKESVSLGNLVNRTTEALEEILLDSKDLNFYQNQIGEWHGIEKSKIRENLKSMYEFAVAIRGNSQDYFNLASIESRIADSIHEESKSLLHYQSAIGYLRKVREEDRGLAYNSSLAINLFDLWDNKQEKDVEETKQILKEAYSEVKTLINTGKKFNTYTTSYMGNILFEIADSDDQHIDISQKEKIFRTGIKYLQEVANLDAQQCDFYNLGNAQATFLYHCLDLKERMALRKEALRNLTKSYELNKDPETLEYIKEIEEDGLEFSG